MRKRLTIIISGPSGVGKGTICERLLQDLDDLALSISCTTRAPRPRKDGTLEENGVEYYFLDEAQFHERIRKGDFLEYAYVHGNYYGTSNSVIEKMKAEGKDIMLEIDMQGALQIKRVEPNAVLIYILPPSYEILRERLTGRGSESPEVLKHRLDDAAEQLSYAYQYDYIVVNDDLETALDEIKGILRACANRKDVCLPLLDSISATFKND